MSMGSAALRSRSLAAGLGVLLLLAPCLLGAQRQTVGSVVVPATGERLYLRLAPGLHFSSVQRVAATAGVTLETDSTDACTPTIHGCLRGPRVVGLAVASPGLTGGRLAVGGAWIAEPLTGVGGVLSLLRTWGGEAQVAPNQTFVGPGASAYLFAFNVEVVSYWRLAGDATGESWFASFRMGIGF